ncbi:hypothetical protein [Streptomyces sp. NPDC002845]
MDQRAAAPRVRRLQGRRIASRRGTEGIRCHAVAPGPGLGGKSPGVLIREVERVVGCRR